MVVAPTNEEIIRQLKIENNELKMQMEEGPRAQVAGIGSYSIPQGNFGIRKDSLMSNGYIGGV